MTHPKILVTGGTGLLGSYVLRWLRQCGLTALTATHQNPKANIPEDLKEGITWKSLVLPDATGADEMIAGQDWVIHTAGLISYDRNAKDRMLEVNQKGTEHIVNACIQHWIKHLVYVSSIGALGKEKDHVTLDDATPWIQNEFSTSYGLSKYLGELEVWRGAGEGLNVSVVLPSVILGSGDWNRSSLQIMDRVARKIGWYPGGQTGFVDVRDVSIFIVKILQHYLSGERWLLSGGDMSYEDLYARIGHYLNLAKKFSLAPKWLAKIYLFSSGLWQGKSLGDEILNHTYGTFSYDARKSRGLEGFEYRDLDTTLREMAEAFQNGNSNQILAFD